MESPTAANHRRLRILLVNHDLNSLAGTLNLLIQHHDVCVSYRAGEALSKLRDSDIDLIMVDACVLGGKSYTNFLIDHIYSEFGRRFPIVALSDLSEASANLEKGLEGTVLMMIKPLDNKNLDTLTSFVSYHASASAPLPGDVAATRSTSEVVASSRKKNNHLWNDELHQSFLRAVDAVGGLAAAKPTTVHQRMLEDGRQLTRYQVASHLQNVRNKAKVVEN